MTDHHTSVRVRALLTLGAVLGLGTVSTLAYWTDQATLTGGTFTAGTLDLKLDGVDTNPAAFSTSFAATNMQPGTSKAASIPVQNAGSIDFTYTATGTTSGGALASLLTFKIVPGGMVNGTATDCTGGTTTYTGTIGTGTGVITTNRPLAVAGSESFCVVATLPTGTTSGQGTSASVSFTFNAKQVGAP